MWKRLFTLVVPVEETPDTRGSMAGSPLSEGNRSSDFFPTTAWTMVQAIQSPDGTIASEALERFCQLYSAPLYGYVRWLGVPHHDAEDLTQDYLCYVIKRKIFQSLSKEKWPLRRFLRVTLKRYIISHQRKEMRQKRGGDQKRITFAEDQFEDRQHSPDVEFDRHWTQALLDRVFDRLRKKYRRVGREGLYDQLEEAIPWHSKDLSHAEIAQRYDTTPNAVKAQLKRLRRAYKDFLVAEVGETVLDAKDVEVEIKYLFSLFAKK